MTLAKQLQRWQADVVAWAEENVHVKDPTTGILGPVRFQDHQRAFLRAATERGAEGFFRYKVAVASWPKREGKTLCVAIILAWRLACFEQQRCGVLANSERQAQSNIFDACGGFFRDSPNLKGLVPDDCDGTRKLTVPATGSSVEAYPCNHRTVQGTRFDLLACDELHAADDGGKAFVFASQQTEAVDAQVLISSQAGAPVESNPLWRLYQADEDFILFDYRQDVVTPWARDRAEKARAELTAGEYDYLWRNCWGATGLRLFPTAEVEAAALEYAEPRTREEWQALVEEWGLEEAACTIGAGLDRAGVGRKGDRSVWSVVAMFTGEALEEPLFRVVMCRVLPTGCEAEVLNAAQDTEAVFGHPAATLFEQYGCGDIVERVRGAELVSPTNPRQATLFNRLTRLLREGRLGFPAGAGLDHNTGTGGLLKSELINVEYDCERGGADGTVLTRWCTQRGHDDTVYSVAWAAEAAATHEAAKVVIEVW